MSYKDIRQNSIYVNLDSIDEISLMGNILDEINFQNDYGTKVSVCYYVEGITKFDKILNGLHFYEYGLTFHLISYENAFAFVLYNPEKQLFFDKVAIWRDQLLDPKMIEKIYTADIIKVNRFINIFKTGALGQGIIGSALSMGIGHTLSKARGIKTEVARVNTFFLEYNTNEDNGINTIIFYTPLINKDYVSSFLIKHYK